MAKEIEKVLKLQIRGGAANPSPPVGPALGAAGVNIMEFCKQFNSRTQDKPGKILPVSITVYKDKSFEFVVKTPPAAVQLLEAAKIKKGNSTPGRTLVGKVTMDDVKKIAEDKMQDLNSFKIESVTSQSGNSFSINQPYHSIDILAPASVFLALRILSFTIVFPSSKIPFFPKAKGRG